ncbi:MAG: ORF6N domain-containing protein [Epsilonproteobacteria bacterium]|nr:MAG: ORF6N domain-containing protein [Campylobacterota bacterium]RLA65807.1 MAG: ORF6N domain-containing protein [Campylobacterota bacterium]
MTPKLIEKMIYVIRGQKVMLDSDLAELYEVETRSLNQAVKRNLDRFPPDFMFQLSNQELISLRSQFVIFNETVKGRKYRPFVFTEQGVAMLSSVLKGKKAALVNISIMRTFVKIRALLNSDETLSERLRKLEKGTDIMFRIVFERLDKLESETPVLPKRRKRIGLKK